MKKIIAVMLIFALLFANASFVSAEEFATEISEEVLELEAPKPELQKLSTPPPVDGELSLLDENIAAEQVDISTQIYENLIALPPSLFLLTDTGIHTLNGWDSTTDSELAYVKDISKEITNSCLNADEKILKVAEYVSKNTCYDYDYVNHHDKEYEEINHSAYDVLVNGSAVCYGYATAAAALLLAANVPCVLVYSPNHAWNMAYNGKRWVLFDPTWMSGGVFEYGELHKSDYVNMDWFDYTLERANSEGSHVITGSSYTCYNGTIYDFPVETIAKSFAIPQNVTAVDEYVFYGCRSLNLSVEGKLTNVGRAAFYECASMDDTVDLSELTFVGEYAFYGCTDLDDIVSLAKLEQVSKCAFYRCYDLDGDIDISNAKIIGEAAFLQCHEIKNVDLKNAEIIEKTAFYECELLERADLSSAKMIEDAAFYLCLGLKDIVSLESVEQIGANVFTNCAMLATDIRLYHAECIGAYVFYGCESLGDVLIGDGVTEIPEAAFYMCGAEDIILPRGLKTIGRFVFAFCDNLKHFYYMGTQEQWKAVIIGENNYNFRNAEMVYNFVPHVNITKPTAENPSVTVTYAGIPEGEVVMFCEYDGNHFLGMQSVTLTKEMKFDLMENQASKINIFVFDDFLTLKPAIKAEPVTLN